MDTSRPRFAFTKIPAYVAQGKAKCHLCEKQNLRFGYHSETKDYCRDCGYSTIGRSGTEFVGRETSALRTFLKQMVQREHQLRMSQEGQAIYAKHGYAEGYLPGTEEIQTQIAVEYLSQPGNRFYTHVQEGYELLKDAPHILGSEAATLSNYIKGSFAAFPEVFAGPAPAAPIHISDLKGKAHMFQDVIQAVTVVVAGSGT